jgi:hypothetical protein
MSTNRYTLFQSPRDSFVVPPKRLKPVVGAFGVSEGEDSGSPTNAPSSAISASNQATNAPVSAPTLTNGELMLDLSSLNLPSPRLSVAPSGTNQATVRVDLKDNMRQTNAPTQAPAPSNQTIPKPPGTPRAVEGEMGIASTVIDRVMKSEGKTAVQSGKREYFGFRADHPAFGKIQTTVKQYGVDSAQTRELVGTLLRQRAKTVGADKFTDPGVQGAVLSIAHMRGEGGAQAILNSVAGAPITKSGKLSNETVNAINSMSPTEFQDRLRMVREQYDKQVYGNKTDSVVINGRTVTGNWWDLFGKGLINRYDRERNEFVAMSQPITTPPVQVAMRKP